MTGQDGAGEGERRAMTDHNPMIRTEIPEMTDAEMLRLRERAFDSVSTGIVITDATLPDNPVIDVNPAFSRITGYAREEVLGNNCRMIQSPQTDPATVRAIREAIGTGREISVTILNQRKDGTPFWNELFISPVHDPDGALTHFVGIQTDITARQRAEERNRFLALASESLGASLDLHAGISGVADLTVPAMADMFYVDLLDDERVSRVLSRYDGLEDDVRADLDAGRPRHLDDRPLLSAVIATAKARLLEDVPGDLIADNTRSDTHREALRRIEILSLIMVPLSARGRTLGALTLLTTARSGRRFGAFDLELADDLGRRMALAIDNAQLFAETQTAVRARDQFLSIAAHELRTPVSSIKGYAQMLMRAQKRGEVSADRIRRSLETIDQSSDRLTLLTSDLLDVSRIRLGQLPLRAAETDLAAMVWTIAQRQGESTARSHRFAVAIARGDYRAVVDADRFDQVMTNLLENAAKYSPGQDEIEIMMEVVGGEIRIAVRDHGIGLPPGGAGTIFEPFERARNAVDRGLPGLGLGLYISRGIIQRHGGQVWAESAGEDRGTTFHVSIPTADHAPDLNGPSSREPVRFEF